MFVILPEWDGFESLMRKQCRTQSACIVETTHSMGSCDHLLHDLPASRLQWPHAAPGQEPHAFVLVAAVHNVDAVAGDCVMECSARVLGDESEEGFPPWIIGVTEQFSAELLQFFGADRTNRFGEGLAALFVEVLKIELFERHVIELIQLTIVRQASCCSL